MLAYFNTMGGVIQVNDKEADMKKTYDPTIDYHCHILPGVDHGCATTDICREQMQFAKGRGVTTLIATSHFYPQNERVDEFLARREKALCIARVIAAEKELTLIPCAETLWCPNIEKMEGLDKLIAKEGGFNHLLLEFPFVEFDTEKAKRSLKNIHETYGCDIILAHVERYSFKQISEFDMDYVHYQINARSFHKLSRMLLVSKYVKTGKVTACGSDIHGLDNTYKYF